MQPGPSLCKYVKSKVIADGLFDWWINPIWSQVLLPDQTTSLLSVTIVCSFHVTYHRKSKKIRQLQFPGPDSRTWVLGLGWFSFSHFLAVKRPNLSQAEKQKLSTFWPLAHMPPTSTAHTGKYLLLTPIFPFSMKMVKTDNIKVRDSR